MFCKVTKKGSVWFVKPTALGTFLKKITFGWIVPSKTFRRDFGMGSPGEVRLIIEPGCNVTVHGNVSGWGTTTFRAIKSGKWSDPEVWVDKVDD